MHFQVKDSDSGGGGASTKVLDYAELKEPEQRLSRAAPLPKESGHSSTETVSKAKYDIIREQLRKTQVSEREREVERERERERGGERERGYAVNISNSQRTRSWRLPIVSIKGRLRTSSIG